MYAVGVMVMVTVSLCCHIGSELVGDDEAHHAGHTVSTRLWSGVEKRLTLTLILTLTHLWSDVDVRFGLELGTGVGAGAGAGVGAAVGARAGVGLELRLAKRLPI